MVGEPTESRRGSHAETAGAAQALGRGGGFALAAIECNQVEQFGRLGDHVANSFCSMNLVGSKFIEQPPVSSS